MADWKRVETMKDRPSIDQDFFVYILICQIAHLMDKAIQKELKQYGVTSRQAAVLLAIQYIGKEATPGLIAQWLTLEPHAISQILTRMEKKKLVRRASGESRNRSVRVTLTEKGQRLKYRSGEKIFKFIHSIMSHLSEEQFQQLKPELKLIRERVFKHLTEKKERLFPV